MYLQNLNENYVTCVSKQEVGDEMLESKWWDEFEPEKIAAQLFGYMSDNDDTQLKCDIEDFLENPKRFVSNYLEETLDLDLRLQPVPKYRLLHSIEGELHAELMKRNLIKRAWVANV